MSVVRSGSKDPGNGTLLPLNGATDPSCAGRKACTLAELSARGFPVPGGWVVPVDLAKRIGTENDPQRYSDLFAVLPDTPMAVRSSGCAEDGDDESLAGRYESILGACGSAEICAAVRKVWESAQKVPASGHNPAASRMAVLIQPMIQPDAAGVAFSANPVTGARQEVVINAVRGLGDRLMAGEVDPETWTVRPGSVECEPSDGSVLSEEQAGRIAALAREIESSFGTPQDIEWALDGDRLSLLQARPITALPVKPELPPLPPGSWVKEVEHLHGIASVMFVSLYIPALQASTRAAFANAGALVEQLRLIDRAGELYIQPVPPGGRHGPPPPGWVLGVLARVVPSMRARVRQCRSAFQSGQLTRAAERWESEWKPELRARGDRLVEVDLASLDDQALRDHARDAEDLVRTGAGIHFELVPPITLATWELVRISHELLGWDDSEAIALIAGTAAASSAPARALQELVDVARERPALLSLLSRFDTTLDDVRRAEPAFAGELDRYRQRFGHRPLGNDVSEPTLYERPDLLLNLIREHLTRDQVTLERSQRRQAEQRHRAEQLLRARPEADRQRFRSAVDRASTMNALREERVLYTLYCPFAVIHYTAQEIGRRLADRGILERAQDVFFCTFDEAVEALEATAPDEDDLAQGVRTRRAERAWTAANPGPLRLGDPPSPPPDPSWLPEPARALARAFSWFLSPRTPPSTGSGALCSGIGASPGRYRGPVRVIRDQRDFHRLRPGDVMVSPITTSAWGILFSVCGALITDHGAILSHPAIAAREYGIPAVVATSDATRTLKEGQIVTVDGSTGTVEPVESP